MTAAPSNAARLPLFGISSVAVSALGIIALLVLEYSDVGKALNGYAGLLLTLTVLPVAVLAIASGLILSAVSLMRGERWRAIGVLGIAIPLVFGLMVLFA
jgi:hypothetical protein